MKSYKNIALIAIILIFLANLVFYTVDETKQAVVLQFGKPVRTVTEAGLHVKMPWPVQTVIYFERRILDYDSAPTEILTEDKKNLDVDNFAKWRIIDPLKFLVTVQNENGAQARLDDIIYSELREALGQHELEEIVSTNRSELMDMITSASDSTARDYGIEVIDVRIKRADLPEQNERSVYERMRAERKRIANRYRSEGEEEALKIRAVTDSLKVVIMAEAYKNSQITRGDADAKAIEIYANAFNQDPEFFEFIRTLEAYKSIIDSNTVLVLPPDTELLKFLK
ncbi:MAG: protease modulator HflC [Calditrichaeota bacterium]|jgi:membrane protease subunit HflC|nr:protease modulator HflC [Calditrichota bacterium]MBT7617974.1 protease modulator HflC [Calditrichota bacterium]MBT7787420.1 protease modulator HflC [Calditrichota bacterium]